jgi:hypothetical protein
VGKEARTRAASLDEWHFRYSLLSRAHLEKCVIADALIERGRFWKRALA